MRRALIITSILFSIGANAGDEISKFKKLVIKNGATYDKANNCYIMDTVKDPKKYNEIIDNFHLLPKSDEDICLAFNAENTKIRSSEK